MQLEKLKIVTELLQDATEELAQSNDDAERAAVYIRPCQPEELVSDLLAEAQAHGCILAFRDHVYMIMPALVPGWTQVHGGRRVLQ